MKKIITLLVSAALIAGAFSACAPAAEEREMNLYTWEGMFPQTVLDGFEEETGIKVNYNNFDYNETMLEKLKTTEGGDYDLVIADDYIIETIIQEGLAQKLDASKIPNIGNVNPIYQAPYYDPTDEYTVPHGVGILSLVYNPDAVDLEITSYADLWDESLKSSIGVLGNPRVVTGITLMSMGESLNTEDVATIEAAGEKLLELAPNIRLIKDDSIQNDLLSGEINAGLMYTSQATQAMIANPDLEVVYAEEGTGFGIIGQFIPSQAPNADEAHEFINYILQPEIGKECFEYLGYYCTNQAADDLISDEYKPFLTLPDYIDPEGMEIMENVSDEALEAHNKVWTAFKDAAE